MLVGDSSDNIPGVRGFGDSAWAKLSDDFKDRLTVALFLDKGKVDRATLEYLLRPEELSEGMKQKLLEALDSGELYKWYRVVSFMDIPDELLELKPGTGLTYLNEDVFSMFLL